MQKLSKSNQDPKQTVADGIALAELNAKTSKHFAVGTGVVSNNVRGIVKGISKDGGSELLIEWEDGTTSAVKNPRYLWKS